VDGDIDEDSKESYSSWEEDEKKNRYLREEQRLVEVEQHLRGNR